VVYWEDQISTITTMFELIPSQDFTAASSNVSVTGLSWNATGAVIAVAYGRFDHSGWCVHTGSICTWNVFKRKMDPKKPDLLLETQVQKSKSNVIFSELCHVGRIPPKRTITTCSRNF
jgi:hypothetical protein